MQAGILAAGFNIINIDLAGIELVAGLWAIA